MWPRGHSQSKGIPSGPSFPNGTGWRGSPSKHAHGRQAVPTRRKPECSESRQRVALTPPSGDAASLGGRPESPELPASAPPSRSCGTHVSGPRWDAVHAERAAAAARRTLSSVGSSTRGAPELILANVLAEADGGCCALFPPSRSMDQRVFRARRAPAALPLPLPRAELANHRMGSQYRSPRVGDRVDRRAQGGRGSHERAGAPTTRARRWRSPRARSLQLAAATAPSTCATSAHAAPRAPRARQERPLAHPDRTPDSYDFVLFAREDLTSLPITWDIGRVQ